VVNPRAGYELESSVDGGGARVAVVGGGPAGMEAARALAASGFGVTLFEAAEELGGQFRMARRIPGKEDFGLTGGYFEQELARLGATVELGARLSGASAELDGFEVVVVATGVMPRAVPLPGADLPHVLSYADLLLADDPLSMVGERVAIIGAGGIGTDVAHLLSERGGFYERYGLEPPDRGLSTFVPYRATNVDSIAPQVTLMRRAGRIGDGVGASTRWVVVQELQQAGAELLTDVEYERIDPDAVVIRVDGETRRIPVDTVIIAAGQVADLRLAAELEVSGRPFVTVGGATGAERLDAGRAFREGHDAPAVVARLLARA
jgi:2,4-dienoyl-CoA reductase (NADPH2)